MATKNGSTPLIVEEEVMEMGNMVMSNARKFMHAGFGLVAFSQDRLGNVQEELTHFFGKLVERGEVVEKDSRKFVTQVVEKRRKQAKETTVKAEKELDKRFEDVVERLNLPTTKDIKSLNTKLNNLTKKINELKKVQAA